MPGIGFGQFVAQLVETHLIRGDRSSVETRPRIAKPVTVQVFTDRPDKRVDRAGPGEFQRVDLVAG